MPDRDGKPAESDMRLAMELIRDMAAEKDGDAAIALLARRIAKIRHDAIKTGQLMTAVYGGTY